MVTSPEFRESERAHRPVKRALAAGIVTSTAALALGTTLRLATGHLDMRYVRPRDFASPMDLGLRLLALGILVLALTPALRILVLIVVWARARDWRFVLVAVLVAATLGASIALGAT